ncbi:hypothetical protein H5410_032325, partial [Solanum commersonii]
MNCTLFPYDAIFFQFEVYSYQNDQFDNHISLRKESAFKMHLKRKVWFLLSTNTKITCCKLNKSFFLDSGR